MNPRVAVHPMPRILKDEHGNLLPYVFQEYPKTVRDQFGEETTVHSRREEDELKNKPVPNEAQKADASAEIEAERVAAGIRAAQNPSATPITTVTQIAQSKYSKKPLTA